ITQCRRSIYRSEDGVSGADGSDAVHVMKNPGVVTGRFGLYLQTHDIGSRCRMELCVFTGALLVNEELRTELRKIVQFERARSRQRHDAAVAGENGRDL